MTNLISFSFESSEIRTLTIDGNPWFVGKDACDALGYKDTVNAIKLHCKGVAKYHPLPTPGGTQEVRIINEPDIYRLITGSTLPEAERFERWLFEEVLPSIRKTGGYQSPGSPSINDLLAAQLAEFLKGKVIVDYDALCVFARVARQGAESRASAERWLEEVERLGLDLEKQCGRPLVCFDIPEERRARHRAAPAPAPANPRPPRPTAPPDPWEAQARAFLADRAEITSAELLAHCGIEPGDQTQSQKNRAAKLLKYLGYRANQVKRNRIHLRVWQRARHV